MPKREPITFATEWVRLHPEPQDWEELPMRELARWFEQASMVRAFEHKILEFGNMGLVHGPAHASIGQEAIAVGCMAALTGSDRMNGTHRAHHQILAKLVNLGTDAEYNPLRDPFSDATNEAIRRFMAEIMGLSSGYAGGRGGSMHMRDPASGVLGTNAIVGGNVPHASGYALADKLLGRDEISVCFFGDGALMQGASYEAMNIAALYDLPVVFFVENNLYAVATRLDEQTRDQQLTSRGSMLGIPSIEVDGMDALAVFLAMREARSIIENGAGPVMIEALCYRYVHQIGLNPGSAFGYRTRSEEGEWQKRDPIAHLRKQLTNLHGIADADLDELTDKATQAVVKAAETLTVPKGNARAIPEEFWPDPAHVEDGILGSGAEVRSLKYSEVEDYAEDTLATSSLIDAAARALERNMARDPSIIVLGEDVHRMRGGVTGVTKYASETYPDRVLAMPIAENGFVGLGLGAALNGLRPVIEIMFSDFCLVAADQLFNQVAKVRHMFGGDVDVPLLVRLRVVPDTGYGSQHSGDHAGLFAMFPGWRIFAPATPFDYVGMLNTALRSNDPVVIIENASLYQIKGSVPKNAEEAFIPFGKAKVIRKGSDCTVLVTAGSMQDTLKAVDTVGVNAEVIDLRSLDSFGVDWETIGDSLRRTNRLMVAEQTAEGLSLGPRIAAGAQARFFDYLDHEIICISGGRASPVVSKPLNAAALADAEKIAGGLKALMSMEETV
ncbi:alpha-ketoacid dehydrogenase subunit alpha/beta [Sinisalibacter aestuarii]|uniref:2-oxoglutarate dehydrogenase E1 component n=1 Tax=Sinisalibacter aestuarii TaxID=2949426 RepID=A0ABQ5LU01_9RHOB|nr:alpha-ketoacid dehydrogenase subunit alpha/beta [Sinisalibacter aestuarii]GKY87746.1 MFS transporter [Sinisalibacter aestuarii]